MLNLQMQNLWVQTAHCIFCKMKSTLSKENELPLYSPQTTSALDSWQSEKSFEIRFRGQPQSLRVPTSVEQQCVHVQSLQSCPALCDSMDCSPPGPSVHGISQARILAWVAMPSSRGSSQSADRVCIIWVSCIGRRVLYHRATGKAVKQDPPVFFHYFWKENKSLIMQFYTRST